MSGSDHGAADTATAAGAPVDAAPPTRARRRAAGHRSTRGSRAKTPTVLQMEAVECGAAALAIVLAHFGRHETLERLRTVCGVSRDGSRASNVLRGARSFGLEAKGFQVDLDGLADLPTPAVLFWEFRHFLVLEGIRSRWGRTRIYLNDPASGPRVITPKQLDDSFTGVALTFAPGPGFEAGGSPSRVLSGLRERQRSARASLPLVLLVSLLLIVPGLATPAFTRVFVDNVLGNGSTDLVPSLLLVMLAAAAVTAALTWLQQSTLLRIESMMAITSAARFVRHLLRLPVEFFAQRQPAELQRRVESNDTVATVLSRDVATTFVNLVLVVFYAIELTRYDGRLAAVGLGLASVNILVLRRVSKLRGDAVTILRSDRGKLVATSFAALSMIETVKANGAENDSFARWAGFQTKVESGRQRLGVPTAVLTATPAFLAMANSGVILLMGSVQAIDGALTIGVLVAFQGLLSNLGRPVQDLTNLGSKIQDVGADITRLRDVERYPAAAGLQDGSSTVYARITGKVDIENITFAYGPLDAPLRPGRRVALVGGSGSGKSTVGKLIAGLYEPREGVVLFDDRPRGVYSRRALAGSVAFVDQDIFLFEGTVRDNVTLWDSSVPDEDVVQALRDAAVYDDIARRPGGIAADVAEGGKNFSGGQRQRLEIARALVTRPSVLVLDEATSALDADIEWLIDDNLRRRGCACVIIAHRLSTIRDSDEIVVMAAGAVVERGTHDELVTRGGAYADLIKAS